MPGKVIIQTYNPNSFPIEYAKEQNYDLFYKTEIELRRQLKYPPFCDIILVGFTGNDEKEIKKVSEYTFKLLNQSLEKYKITIFSPTPAPIDKIQNKIRWRIIAKGNVTEDVTIILNKCLQKLYNLPTKHTQITISKNPNNMI